MSGDASINYREALAWLYSLQRFGIKLGLENIQRCSHELIWERGVFRVQFAAPSQRSFCGQGHPCRWDKRQRLRLRHDRFDLSRARISHRSVHIPSPRHVSRTHSGQRRNDFRRAVANGLTTIRDLVANWDPHPTFFEVMTALALKHFSRREDRHRHFGNRSRRPARCHERHSIRCVGHNANRFRS